MTTEVICEGCDEPIPAKRIEVVPDATKCVACLSGDGDIQRYKGIRTSNTQSGQLSGCEDNIIRDQDKLKDLKFPTRRVCK